MGGCIIRWIISACPFGITRLISNIMADGADKATLDIHQGDGVLIFCHDRARQEAQD